jgi:ATP-dependent protease ClpP protease subunit
MSKRIEIRGVIVPSDYDTEWAMKYIDKGLFTPESYFRRALNEADVSKPLSVYINSPGGSVFAANEMVNAVREWKLTNNQPVEIVIGAMAASAASMFAISVGDQIKTHSNGKMMFHGAWTVSIGGKELHEDQAELLGKINADIQSRLVSKYNLAPETVAEWFAEGREGWLSADEMVQSGIASGMIDDAAEVIEFPNESVVDIEQRGLGIAAMLEIKNEVKDVCGKSNDEAVVGGDAVQSDDEGDSGDQQPDAAAEAVAGTEAGTTEGTEGQPADDTAEPSDEYNAGKEAGAAEVTAAMTVLKEGYESKIESLNALASKLQSEKDKLRAELDKITKQNKANLEDMSAKLKDATDRLGKFLSGGLSFCPAPKTWAEAMTACNGDYVAAARAYPELKDAYNKAKQTN